MNGADFMAGAACGFLLGKWYGENPEEAKLTLSALGEGLLGGLEIVAEHLENSPEVMKFLQETVESQRLAQEGSARTSGLK